MVLHDLFWLQISTLGWHDQNWATVNLLNWPGWNFTFCFSFRCKVYFFPPTFNAVFSFMLSSDLQIKHLRPPLPLLWKFARQKCTGVALGPTQPAPIAMAWTLKGGDAVDQDHHTVTDTLSGIPSHQYPSNYPFYFPDQHRHQYLRYMFWMCLMLFWRIYISCWICWILISIPLIFPVFKESWDPRVILAECWQYKMDGSAMVLSKEDFCERFATSEAEWWQRLLTAKGWQQTFTPEKKRPETREAWRETTFAQVERGKRRGQEKIPRR